MNESGSMSTKYGRAPVRAICGRARDEAVGRRDDRVAGADVGRAQREVERVGTRGDADHVRARRGSGASAASNASTAGPSTNGLRREHRVDGALDLAPERRRTAPGDRETRTRVSVTAHCLGDRPELSIEARAAPTLRRGARHDERRRPSRCPSTLSIRERAAVVVGDRPHHGEPEPEPTRAEGDRIAVVARRSAPPVTNGSPRRARSAGRNADAGVGAPSNPAPSGSTPERRP